MILTTRRGRHRGLETFLTFSYCVHHMEAHLGGRPRLANGWGGPAFEDRRRWTGLSWPPAAEPWDASPVR